MAIKIRVKLNGLRVATPPPPTERREHVSRLKRYARLKPRYCDLMPDVPAKERVFAWRPARETAERGVMAHPVIARIRLAAARAALRDAASVGSGIKKYMCFCDAFSIPHIDRFPSSLDLLHAFALWAAAPQPSMDESEAAGDDTPFEPVLASTARKYLSDIRAWHITHGLRPPLSPDDWALIDQSLRGLANLEGEDDKEAPRPPVLVQHMRMGAPFVDRASPFESACWSATTLHFASAARGSDSLPNARKEYRRGRFTHYGSVRRGTDAEGRPFIEFPIPRPKTKNTLKEQVLLATRQSAAIDPIAAFEHHVAINRPGPDDHVFSWRDKAGRLRPLTKGAWIKCGRKWWRAAGIDQHVTAHCFRIGGASFWLSVGMSSDYVRWLGRWSSNSFDLYVRSFRLLAPQHMHMKA